MSSSENKLSCSRTKIKVEKSASLTNQHQKENLVHQVGFSIVEDKNSSEHKECKVVQSSSAGSVKTEPTEVINVESKNSEGGVSTKSKPSDDMLLNTLLEETLYAKQQEFFSSPEVILELKNLSERFLFQTTKGN